MEDFQTVFTKKKKFENAEKSIFILFCGKFSNSVFCVKNRSREKSKQSTCKMFPAFHWRPAVLGKYKVDYREKSIFRVFFSFWNFSDFEAKNKTK